MSLIYYHRAYKKISNPGRKLYLEFIICSIPLSIAIFLIYPFLLSFINHFAMHVLTPFHKDIRLLEKSFLIRDIYLLDFMGKYPSTFFSLTLFLFSLLCILMVRKTNILKPLINWLVYLSLINLISSVFFILIPLHFPYTIGTFSELYMKIGVCIWLFLPFAMTLALLPIPSRLSVKFTVISLTILYIVVFGAFRYVVFLYILGRFSYIFMPALFFAFGPLLDFIFVVSIYSVYISLFAKKKSKDLKTWKWSY